MTEYKMKASTYRRIVENVHDEDYIIIKADNSFYDDSILIDIDIEYFDRKEEVEKTDNLANMHDRSVYIPMFPKHYPNRVNSMEESITKEYLLKEYNITEEELKEIENLVFEKGRKLRKVMTWVIKDKRTSRSMQLADELKSYLEEYVLPPAKQPVELF